MCESRVTKNEMELPNDAETKVAMLQPSSSKIKKLNWIKHRKCMLCSICACGLVAMVITSVLFVCFADSAYFIRVTLGEKLGIRFSDYQKPATLRKFMTFCDSTSYVAVSILGF